MTDLLSIVTGAPGVGKTTVLHSLDGTIPWVTEPARELIADRLAAGVETDMSRQESIDALLARSIEKYQCAQATGTPTVFDRGIPDCIAYALYLGADPGPSIEAAQLHRYHPRVLILGPWEEIYTIDDMRTMSFAQVLLFHDRVLEAYDIAGYTLVEVPRGTIADRAAFIEDHVASA
ncbi:MAG: ATP-binding protein [Actinomycetota bacterium]